MNTLHPIFQQILKPYMPMNTTTPKPPATQAHTPTPWRIWRSMLPTEPRKIVGQSDDGICTIDEYNTNDDANAALIVRAVNSHKALLDALRDCLAYDCKRTDAPARIKARAAIALAEQQP